MVKVGASLSFSARFSEGSTREARRGGVSGERRIPPPSAAALRAAAATSPAEAVEEKGTCRTQPGLYYYGDTLSVTEQVAGVSGPLHSHEAL